VTWNIGQKCPEYGGSFVAAKDRPKCTVSHIMVTALRSKWAAGKAVRAGLAEGGRTSESICNRSGSRP